MTKKHHRKKRIPKLIRTRRFSAVVAILLVVVSAGLGYAWLRGSFAYTKPTSMTIRAYDVTAGQKRLIVSPGMQIRAAIFQDDGRGITLGVVPFHYQTGVGSFGGFGCLDFYYCNYFNVFFDQFTNLPAGMEIAPSSPIKVNNPVRIIAGVDNSLELQLRYPDGDGDGVPDKDDNCKTQGGPASNRGCPVPAPQAAAPKPAPAPAAPKSSTTSRSVATAAKPAATPQQSGASSTPAPTDSVPPAAPTNLKLTSPSSGVVALTWDAATDDTGVTRYSVERSSDQQAWDMLNDNIIETAYTDAEAGFGKKYFYRVIAYDAATNASASVDGEIVTGEFQPNVKTDEEATISSDDSQVTVTIPSGAIEEELDCRIVQQGEVGAALPNNAEAKSPPYKLVCKKADGSSVETFRQPLRYAINVDTESMGDLTPALFTFADEAWTKSDTAYSADAGGFSLESDQAQTFIVAGIKQSNLIPMIITGLVLLLLVVAAAIWFIRRRGGGDSDYSSASYMNTATTPSPAATPEPVSPTAPVVPGTPPPAPTVAPNPINNAERPGQHAIHVPGEVKAPFADQQDPSMPTISHHSPLDRLDDQSTAGSSTPVDQSPK